MKIIIAGLRRSGTTIFWQTLRQDRRLLCFNEPFNPLLRELPDEIPNRSRREMIEIFHKDPRNFWRILAPIGRIEELQEGMSDRQREYLRFLFAAGPRTCFDTTRCHFKTAVLAEEAPDAILIHLKRHPAAMASSHLIPSGSGGRRATWMIKRYGQASFWTRRERFNNWGIEELIGRRPESLFGQRMREAGLDPDDVYELPAVGKLLAYWKVCTDRLEADGPRYFGDRFLSVRFEDFCAHPQRVVDEVYGLAGEPPPKVDVTRVHPPHPPFQADSPRWEAILEHLGISVAEWAGSRYSGSTQF